MEKEIEDLIRAIINGFLLSVGFYIGFLIGKFFNLF